VKIKDTELPGVCLLDLEPAEDARGYLVRMFCESTFASRGLNTTWVQTNLSRTLSRGMLRGLHYQRPPMAEVKLIQCVTGAVYDVIVDVRRSSPTFGRWLGIELSEQNHTAIYVPEGYAHGFQCLVDDCRIHYHMSSPYSAALAAGVRWDDPLLGIPWPLAISAVSERDATLPFLAEIR